MHKAILLKEANGQEVLVIPSFRHFSNKYKLEREGINKEKYFFLGRSQVVWIKVSFQLSLENCQGYKVPRVSNYVPTHTECIHVQKHESALIILQGHFYAISGTLIFGSAIIFVARFKPIVKVCSHFRIFARI